MHLLSYKGFIYCRQKLNPTSGSVSVPIFYFFVTQFQPAFNQNIFGFVSYVKFLHVEDWTEIKVMEKRCCFEKYF